MSLTIVFQSYKENGRMIMKVCALELCLQSEVILLPATLKTRTASLVDQRLTHQAGVVGWCDGAGLTSSAGASY